MLLRSTLDNVTTFFIFQAASPHFNTNAIDGPYPFPPRNTTSEMEDWKPLSATGKVFNVFNAFFQLSIQSTGKT
jgi:hypothetical protein